MPEQLLPLFPLSAVLLPATPIPLHIFEGRYKELMGDVIPSRGEFGIVMAKDEGIVNIGCTAVVDRVLQRYPDGRMDLVAIGQRRFTVLSPNDEKSYLRATVEFFNDEEASDVPVALRERAIVGYLKLRQALDEEMLAEPRLDDPQMSFQLGQLLSDLDKRQVLLSMRSEVDRLEYLLAILPDHMAKVELTRLARRVGPLNGHAKHFAELK
jgi:ATP-dependent Lon protease